MDKINFKAKFEAQMKEFDDAIKSGAFKLDGDDTNKFKQLRLYMKSKNSPESHLNA